MKILVLQLARLGDIYMSWPGLRALRRHHPEAEIHFLTRARFEGAVQGLDAVDRHWTLPSQHLLSPLVQDNPDVDLSVERMAEWVEEFKGIGFDRIINLSFSPFSSYLVTALAQPETQIQGYCRHSDGSFALVDEVSAYFYAQVGPGRANRVHLADIFASLMNVEYSEEDWRAPVLPEKDLQLPETYIVVHIAASENHKSLTPSQWGEVLRALNNHLVDLPVVLIGSKAERHLVAEIQNVAAPVQILDWVGKTEISDLFQILSRAQLLVGGDSMPMHIASLTDTASLNLSLGSVNFWETGPKASLSFVLRKQEPPLEMASVGSVMAELLQGRLPSHLAVRAAGVASYECQESAAERFQWDLIQAIYMQGDYPLAERIEIIQGAMKLQEINTFAMEQLQQIDQKGLASVAPFLERAEEVIESISRFVPELSPLINWYRTEKTRIGPGTQEDVYTATLNVHQALARHVKAYVPQSDLAEEGMGDGTL